MRGRYNESSETLFEEPGQGHHCLPPKARTVAGVAGLYTLLRRGIKRLEFVGREVPATGSPHPPHQQRLRDRQPQRLRGLEVDDELELGGLLDGKASWTRPPDDLVDVRRALSRHLHEIQP